MDPRSRQNAIVDHLDLFGAASYEDLATSLGVAEMTVRRDVNALAREKRVIKTLGGVQTAGAPKQFYESELQQRMGQNAWEKRAIALQAMLEIKPHQTIFLDGGTTSLALSKALASSKKRLTVVSNSALVCLELGNNPRIVVVGIGGQFDHSSQSFVGPTTEELAGRFFVDMALFSTKGVVIAEGTFESSIANLRLKQIIAEQASKVVLLVDHSKFGTRSLCRVLEMRQINQVITDSKTSKSTIREIERAGPRVVLASLQRQLQEASSDVA